MQLQSTDYERFLRQIDRNPDGCWLWQGSLTVYGYGRLVWHRGQAATHRIAWELWVGPIPPGACVLHRCDVRRCVRPDHLFLGSKGDNNRDRTAKGRSAFGNRNGKHTHPESRMFGERNPRAVLTTEIVLEIRRAYPSEGISAIGRRLGLRKDQVWRVVHRKVWGHI